MIRSLALFACVAGCAAEATDPVDDTAVAEAASLAAFHRAHVTGDLYHYSLDLPVGSTPNAVVRIHRIVRELAPYVPRPTPHAAMLLHGDFSTFATNFAPGLGDPVSPVRGLAPYLAARDIDAWGVDRRWAIPGATDDISDFATIGVARELDDLRIALAVARAVRLAGGSGGGKLALVGFSHGAQLAYTYASVEAARPPAQRHVDAIAPLDFYGAFTPEQDAERAIACEGSAGAYQAVIDGFTDSPNDFQILAGQLARSAPNDPSPLIADQTNRQVMLWLVGQTYVFVPYAPFYHLLSPIVAGGEAVNLRETSELAATAWLAGATPHQALLEAADFDALLCPTGPQPVDAPLSRIRVPVFYIGAAGGVGSLGVHSTTLVSSTDVKTLVVQRFGPERRADDFGHADLLLATDAPALVWKPLATWLAQH